MKYIVLLFVVCGSLITGCTKYKPAISFTSENKRIVGEWQLDEISSSGTGVNSQKSSGTTKAFYNPTVLKLNIDQTASLDGYILTKDVDSVSHQNVTGSWALEGKELTIKWDGDNVYNPEVRKYELKYLSKKKLEISYQQVNYGGGISGLKSDFTSVYRFKK